MTNSLANLKMLPGLLAIAFLYYGCSKNETIVGSEQIVGSGRIVSAVRSVGTFTGIQVTNLATVFVTQDTVESLHIEADDNILDRALTSVNSGTLIVGLKEGSYSHVTFNVYASMRTIRRLESVGVADFSSTNSIQTDSIVCRIVGAGSITLTGKTNYEVVEISGAGDVHNFNLTASRGYASIAGTGNIELTVTQQLDAVIAGAGTILYAGNPPVVHQGVTGVGSVRPRL